MKNWETQVCVLAMATLLLNCAQDEQLRQDAKNSSPAASETVTEEASATGAEDEIQSMLEDTEQSDFAARGGRQFIIDFLIQDVCLDRYNRVVSQDPYTCKKRRNTYSSDRRLPYAKIDMGNGFESGRKIGWQLSDSIPMRAKNRRWYLVKTFDFGGPNFPGKKWGVFEDMQDGWDVTEINGTYVSYVGTKDGTNDNHWAGANCRLDDGWVLFPTFMRPGQVGNVSHDIYNVHVRQNCNPSQRNQANAAWHWLKKPVQYSGGQSMETITTHHWSHPKSTDSTSFEMNYYTRQYGATRWEAWQKCSSPRNCTPAKDANNCNGQRTMTIHGAPWKRMGCRDWTYIKTGWRKPPRFWTGLVDYRLCLYGQGSKFGDGKTCLQP